MRLLTLQIVAAGLFVGAAGGGQTSDEARALLDKAIRAHGGAEALAKQKAGTMKNKGRLELGGGIDFTQEVNYQLPNKFRDEMELDAGGKTIRTLTVYDGTKASLTVDGKKLDLGGKLTDMLKDATYLVTVSRLLPLRDKGFELTAIGETKVNDKPALGLRVSKKGRRDVSLYFDKATGLLAKVEHRTVDLMSGQEVLEERIVTEYQKVDGVPQAKKLLLLRDGKKFLEAEVVEMKHFEKLDNAIFTVP